MIVATGLKEHVKIGAMDRRVTVRTKTATATNGLGEVTTVTNSDTTVFAHVMNEDRPEDYLNDKKTVVEMRTFVIRYRSLAYTDFIVYDSNEYKIIAIEEIGRRRFLKVKTERVV